MRSRMQAGTLTLLLAFWTFIWLGIPDGLRGVAWEDMRRTFDVPLDALGVMLTASTIGYLASSFTSGRLAAQYGMGMFLLLSNLLRGIGLLGYALAPSWGTLIAFNVLFGLGGGGIDAGLNAYVAAYYSAGRMNLLHACFGIGATIGPIIMTGVLNLGESWQWGYAAVGLLQFMITLVFLLTLPQWSANETRAAAAVQTPVPRAPLMATLRLPAAWFGILIFFMLAGVELSTGQWPFSLFTEERAISEDVARVWVSVFWGGLTVGRLLMGVLADRVGTMRVLRFSMLGTVIGTTLIWVQGASSLNAAGMALTGFSLATLFPSLISITPARVGPAHAANAIGFQVGAAGIGIAALPALGGVVARGLGLEAIGPFLVACSAAMWLLYELTIHRAPQQHAVAPVGVGTD